LYFTIFSVVRSLAKLVIEDQEHLWRYLVWSI
jgi:hypothetical protein